MPAPVLSIAGFDPVSGAGISADLKTFAALGCYGLACITALTVQNSTATRRFEPVDAALLDEQLDFLLQDIAPAAIKIGMLGADATVEVVGRHLRQQRERNPALPIVVDPVILSSSGAQLATAAALERMCSELLPLATVLTPNVPEAARLSGIAVKNLHDAERAAALLRRQGPEYVVVTGGHLEQPVDVFYDGTPHLLASDRVPTSHTHGTGCTYSSAIAALLAHGATALEAATGAKQFVTAALSHAHPVGHGRGPLNHLFRLEPWGGKS